MTRRYTYPKRLTARELSEAMQRHELTPHMLAKVSGAAEARVHGWLQGETSPPHITRDFALWDQDPGILELALIWADEAAEYNA